jgi:hypothetical protein
MHGVDPLERPTGCKAISYSHCRDAEVQSSEVVKLALWCLNPAVAFAALSAESHSVILTSGTLSPMASFASEVCCRRCVVTVNTTWQWHFNAVRIEAAIRLAVGARARFVPGCYQGCFW